MQLPLVASGAVMMVAAVVFGLERRLRGRALTAAVYGLVGLALVGTGVTHALIGPYARVSWWVFVVVLAFAALRVGELFWRKRRRRSSP